MNSWNNCYKNGEHKNNKQYPETFVIKFLTSKAFREAFETGERVSMDIGCGFGRNIGILLEISSELIAIDPSKEAIDYIKKEYMQVASYTYTPPELPKIKSNPDLILACNSIYYLGDYEFDRYFKSIVDILKENGLFIFSMIGDQHDCLINKKILSEDIVEMNNSGERYKSRLKTIIYKPHDYNKFEKKIESMGLNILEKGEILEKYSITGVRHIITYLCQKNTHQNSMVY